MTTTVAPGPASMAAPFVSLKAMPFGWPPASLDPDSGHDPKHGAEAVPGSTEPKMFVFTVSGDCRPARTRVVRR